MVLAGKNIIVEWRGFEFLSTAMSMLDRHIDRTNPETQLHWKMLEAVSAQRVDHLNWRHGATYLIAAEFRAVMYATSNRCGSEFFEFVSWLVDRCPPALKSELNLIFDRYLEIAQCISTPSQPILVRIERAPIESLRTERSGDASGVLRKLVERYASDRKFFDQIKQIGVFELCRPFRVLNVESRIDEMIRSI